MGSHRLLIAALGIALAAGFPSRGTAGPPPGAISGRVLLLNNQRVLEGEVERVGEQYRVRRAGGETFVPAGVVLAVCEDLDGAYRFLLNRTDTRDPDARMQLARWCDANGLRQQAVLEAKAVVELQPKDAKAQAVLKQLQLRASLPAPVPVPAKLPAAVIAAASPEPIDCGAEAFKRFVAKVQPVLMNVCAQCHAGEAAGKFRLERVYADGLNSRTAAQQNLALTLAQIDRAKPAASPLLLQATTAHGGAAVPPLRDRGVPAYKLLDEWVQLVIAESGSSPAPLPSAPAVATAGAMAAKPGPEGKTEFGVGAPPKDAPPEAPADPFDPAIFNRQHHPDRAKPAEPPSGPKP